ncbi:hypothetical protein GCM10010191_49590 [Actinomadura vinacea]|uniref:Uncharacterized protein n=1 Tax=Actinomadura vinacea TaxID=115336 RepID=A0ABP5WPJ3_9ACTN
MANLYLVRHDYGMGALWWWINAESPSDITDAFAEVEVVEDLDDWRRAESWNLEEFDLADAAAGPLASLAQQQAEQRLRSTVGARRSWSMSRFPCHPGPGVTVCVVTSSRFLPATTGTDCGTDKRRSDGTAVRSLPLSDRTDDRTAGAGVRWLSNWALGPMVARAGWFGSRALW